VSRWRSERAERVARRTAHGVLGMHSSEDGGGCLVWAFLGEVFCVHTTGCSTQHAFSGITPTASQAYMIF